MKTFLTAIILIFLAQFALLASLLTGLLHLSLTPTIMLALALALVSTVLSLLFYADQSWTNHYKSWKEMLVAMFIGTGFWSGILTAGILGLSLPFLQIGNQGIWIQCTLVTTLFSAGLNALLCRFLARFLV